MSWKDGKKRLRWEQVGWIILIWTLLGALDALNTHAMGLSGALLFSENYDFSVFFAFSVAAAFLASLVTAPLLVFYLRDRLRRRTFGFSLLVNSLVAVLLNFIISGFTIYSFIVSEGVSPALDPETGRVIGRFFTSALFLKLIVFWSAVVFSTLLMLNVNEKYGPGVFLKLLLGRYHRPSEEERIFMFVDIRSATTIAEQLGHIRFFNLLNDFFTDITEPITYTQGEIYQYVGDQVVISWSMKKGLKNANCIQCFYNMKEEIHKFAWRYRQKYGLAPEFKAGLHCGPVTIGEIGLIKKDIVYSGDVLNTASRIESVCNKFRVNILLSRVLLDKLQLPPHFYEPKRVGVIELKGKMQKVELYTFEQSQEENLPKLGLRDFTSFEVDGNLSQNALD